MRATTWTQDVNWTYRRRSYVRSIYVLCLGGSSHQLLLIVQCHFQHLKFRLNDYHHCLLKAYIIKFANLAGRLQLWLCTKFFSEINSSFNFFEIIEINVIIKNISFWKVSDLSQKITQSPYFIQPRRDM